MMMLTQLLAGVKSFAGDEGEPHKPSGSPFLKIYFNHHSVFSGGERNSGFDITRAYLGYSYKYNEHFSIKMNLDVGKSKVDVDETTTVTSSLNYTAYLKNAYLKYSGDKISVSAGMIGLKNFKVQETFWGHRYLYKSLQDEHKYAPSADLGAVIEYKASDALSADFTVRNGEGYKKVQLDNVYNYGFGLSFTPVKQLMIRAYYDMSMDVELRSVITGFLGYQGEKVLAGAEYNYIVNDKYSANHNQRGISGFASWNLAKGFQLFGRYDLLASNVLITEVNPWNIGKDGSAYIAGIQFSPAKVVKCALNYRLFDPAEAGDAISNQVYLNFEYSFK